MLMERFKKRSMILQSEKLDLNAAVKILVSLPEFVAPLRPKFHEFEERGRLLLGINVYKEERCRERRRNPIHDYGIAKDPVLTLRINSDLVLYSKTDGNNGDIGTNQDFNSQAVSNDISGAIENIPLQPQETYSNLETYSQVTDSLSQHWQEIYLQAVQVSLQTGLTNFPMLERRKETRLSASLERHNQAPNTDIPDHVEEQVCTTTGISTVHQRRDFKVQFLFCHYLETTTKEKMTSSMSLITLIDCNYPERKFLFAQQMMLLLYLGIHSAFRAWVKTVNPVSKDNHCMLHRYALASTTLPSDLKLVLDDVATMVNFIKSNTLNTRVFHLLCQELYIDHQNLLFYTEVRWLSRGNMLSLEYIL
ncbi:Zinc finger protein [Oopsacas minuta]|uniref:Zinc finger protein n=1 Tax=Oopsacas minuta TaxID=111878 RepID=A0AAV7JBU0_9METZ|nr:Zinc finger protein [Oopsacas minuta]